jgi:hypothetical protein
VTENKRTRQFDQHIQRVTQDRGDVYGHPLENFGRSQALKALVKDCSDVACREALEQICVKIARLCRTPDHVDSWVDIAGYARTAVMALDKQEKKHG